MRGWLQSRKGDAFVTLPAAIGTHVDQDAPLQRVCGESQLRRCELVPRRPRVLLSGRPMV